MVAEDVSRKRLLEIQRMMDVLAGESAHLQRLILELLSASERRVAYEIQNDPTRGDLAQSIRSARQRRRSAS